MIQNNNVWGLLADWFSQDYDIVSGSTDNVATDFYYQHGAEVTKQVADILEVNFNLSCGSGFGDFLLRSGWEWIPNNDYTGETWAPQFIEMLRMTR